MSYTTFDFRSVPCDWTLCFIHNCPLKATCMRYFVGEQVPMSETWGSANTILKSVLYALRGDLICFSVKWNVKTMSRCESKSRSFLADTAHTIAICMAKGCLTPNSKHGFLTSFEAMATPQTLFSIIMPMFSISVKQYLVSTNGLVRRLQTSCSLTTSLL